jgi:hypothetical protein
MIRLDPEKLPPMRTGKPDPVAPQSSANEAFDSSGIRNRQSEHRQEWGKTSITGPRCKLSGALHWGARGGPDLHNARPRRDENIHLARLPPSYYQSLPTLVR